jgi:hypothetical protein
VFVVADAHPIIHLFRWNEGWSEEDFEALCPPRAPYLALLGDIGVLAGGAGHYAKFLAAMVRANTIRCVQYVCLYG